MQLIVEVGQEELPEEWEIKAVRITPTRIIGLDEAQGTHRTIATLVDGHWRRPKSEKGWTEVRVYL